MKSIIPLTAVLVSLLILVFSNYGESNVVTYDCSMAEWHPDIPSAVKEECRRIRHEELEKLREEKKNKLIIT